MAIREILLLGNPVLRKECAAVKKADDPATCRTITDLADTLNNFRRLKGFGRGIAAPQIGAASRIIFINVDEPMALINPKIVSRSRTMMTLWDDCFSFPDILVNSGDTPRSQWSTWMNTEQSSGWQRKADFPNCSSMRSTTWTASSQSTGQSIQRILFSEANTKR
jgi:peptide deformylase